MKGETFCMHLYLLRHGIAVEAQAGESDATRALTSDGRRKLRKVLKAVAEAKVKPTLMWSSELKRAIQTAEVAKAVLGYQGEILRTKALAPGADTEQVWEEIRVHRPPVIHLVRFPRITINHAVVVFDASPTESGIRFLTYDPNYPDEPQALLYERRTRSFTFANFSAKGRSAGDV